MTEEQKKIFIVGKIKLNGRMAPFIEIVLDTADGRHEGEIILLEQIHNVDNEYYIKKINKNA